MARLTGRLVYIRPYEAADAKQLLELQRRNRSFLQPFEPVRRESDFTLDAMRRFIGDAKEASAADRAYRFGVFERASDSLVGSVALSNVSRAAWQNATVGYFIDRQHNSKGFATEAVELVVTFAFDHAGLHRVQGAVMPRNPASRRVLEKVGFSFEGHARRYLQINGVWEDHDIFAITREVWVERRRDAGLG